MEDDRATLDLWALSLRLVGYATITAQSVAETRKRLAESPVDLVITDWQLADGTGNEVCEAIRQGKPAVPVIVISGVTNDRVTDIMTCTPDAYFTKPVTIRTLVETIERLLNTGRTENSV